VNVTKKANAGKPNRAQVKQELWKAVKAADTVTITRLAEQDPTVLNARNSQQATPLTAAAATGNLDIVKLLVDLGAETVWTEHDGRESDLLGTAAAGGWREVGQHLISIGLEATAIHAAGLNDLDRIKAIMKSDPDALESVDPRTSDRPIHVAGDGRRPTALNRSSRNSAIRRSRARAVGRICRRPPPPAA
jgi:ankyrin repeat protein